jgi:hypothetical protein
MKLQCTKGGRGKVAPYETTHQRIPVKIALYVNFVSNSYKQAVVLGNEQEFLDTLNNTTELISTGKHGNENTLDNLAKEIVRLRKQKKSTKTALDNLLTAILGDNYE